MMSYLFAACLSLTTQQAFDLMPYAGPVMDHLQQCMDDHAGEAFYTDICISKEMPEQTLIITDECVGSDCHHVHKLVKNGLILN